MLDTLDPIDVQNPLLPHPLNEGRVLWLYGCPPLDGGRQWFDLCGLNHGTLTNGPTWVATGRGDSGLSMTAASSQYASGFGVIPATGDFTAAIWAKPTANPTGGNSAHLFGWYQSGGSYPGWGLARAGPTDSLNPAQFQVWDGTSWKGFGAGVDWTLNQPIRVLLSVSGTAASLYLNGQFAATKTLAARTNWSGNRAIGADSSGASAAATTGLLSDPAVWSRALPAADAFDDYDLSQRGYPGVLRRHESALTRGA